RHCRAGANPLRLLNQGADCHLLRKNDGFLRFHLHAKQLRYTSIQPTPPKHQFTSLQKKQNS
ncbi:MAG: hypothetical protein KA511_01840, partial [Brachymonas sp.]|nr:hypothetical protein [Brachymonas sp.]MBP6138340.1 hypothetical protein [Brachymonas sp.]MBP6967243.1 hypothetical protein [Brachymonas sp.]MBP7744021.1 hypothetical protein [Brachymonas sp.]